MGGLTQPGSSVPDGPARIVASSPMGSRSCQARRSAYPRASADAGSTHGRSSMATITGRSAARIRRLLRVATPTVRGSTGSACRSSSRAAASPSACGSGRVGSTRSTTGPRTSARTTWAMAVSASTQRATSTVRSRRAVASTTPCDQIALLPIPASPVRTMAAGPVVARSTTSPMRASSSVRPRSAPDMAPSVGARRGPPGPNATDARPRDIRRGRTPGFATRARRAGT